MTAKQFIGSLACAIAEKAAFVFPRLRRAVRYLFAYLFPSFIWHRNLGFQPKQGIWRTIVFLYLAVFIATFAVQAVWAHFNGVLFPHSSVHSFLEDIPNLINYTVICELYVIFGVLFLIEAGRLDDWLQSLNIDQHTDDPPPRTAIWGAWGALLVLLATCIATAGYATEILGSKTTHWYMDIAAANANLRRFSTAGYYYLLINFLLLLLVLWAAVSHAALFRAGGRLARHIRQLVASGEKEPGNKELVRDFINDPKLIEKLVPFSRAMLFSKAFVFALLLNLLTWQAESSVANVSVMYAVSVIALTALGIWIFSLPRYTVQLALFEAKKSLGLDEYKDIRPAWLLGASAAIDVSLFSYLVTSLLGPTAAKIFEQYLN